MYVLKVNDKVWGYITIAMAHLKADATKEIKNMEVNGTIPAVLISHLAVHKINHQRQHVGKVMLKKIILIITKKITTTYWL